jgi:peptide/nickel transport system permease protein
VKGRITSILLRILVTLAFAAVLGYGLVRFAPGFGVDERELDARFDSSAVAAIRDRAQAVDWSTSQAFGVPVRQLFADRWITTLASVTGGLALAWFAALLVAFTGTISRVADAAGSVLSFGLLSIPAGLVAIGVFLAGGPVAAGIAASVFPQVYRYVRQLLLDAVSHPAIFAASARGVPRFQVVTRHAGALMRPQLLALLGSSAAIATGAAIPMEALCDSPGLGQLAWKAAVARDLPVLMPLIAGITLVIQAANAATEVSSS